MDAQLQSREGHATAILLTACSLIVIGLLAVASASARLDQPLLHADVLHTTFGRQVVFAFLGVGVMLATSCVSYRMLSWRGGRILQSSVVFTLVGVGLLVAVLIPGVGDIRNGAQRWIYVGSGAGGIGFQPSEIAKLAMVVFLAAYLGSCEGMTRRFWRGFVPAMLVIGIVCGLIGEQDFGTAALLAAVGAAVVLMSGARAIHLIGVALPAALMFGWLLLSKPYRIERLTGYLRIWEDPRGTGYQAVQSLITIVSGGWRGVGLGQGMQKHGFLPECTTDAIFAVWCEETGMFGALVVLALFGALAVLGGMAALRAKDAFGRLLAIGLTLLISLQAAMNLAVVTVSVPTKGIALPLVSAGGTSLVVLCAAVGLLASVARFGRTAVAGEECDRIPSATAATNYGDADVAGAEAYPA